MDKKEIEQLIIETLSNKLTVGIRSVSKNGFEKLEVSIYYDGKEISSDDVYLKEA